MRPINLVVGSPYAKPVSSRSRATRYDRFSSPDLTSSLRRSLGLALTLLLVITGCGGAAKSSVPGSATIQPSAPTTPSPTPSGNRFVVDDPAGDCLTHANQPIACDPPALDMKRFMIEKDAVGDIIVTIEISGAGFAALSSYLLIIGIDTDRNVSTGNTSGYPLLHGLAPDIELAYGTRQGLPPGGLVFDDKNFPKPMAGDASLVSWKQLEATRIQATIKPALLNGASSFWVVSDLALLDRYDHVPDNGRIAFPEGKVLPK